MSMFWKHKTKNWTVLIELEDSKPDPDDTLPQRKRMVNILDVVKEGLLATIKTSEECRKPVSPIK